MHFPFVAPLPGLRFKVQGLGVRIMAPRLPRSHPQSLASVRFGFGLDSVRAGSASSLLGFGLARLRVGLAWVRPGSAPLRTGSAPSDFGSAWRPPVRTWTEAPGPWGHQSEFGLHPRTLGIPVRIWTGPPGPWGYQSEFGLVPPGPWGYLSDFGLVPPNLGAPRLLHHSTSMYREYHTVVHQGTPNRTLWYIRAPRNCT